MLVPIFGKKCLKKVKFTNQSEYVFDHNVTVTGPLPLISLGIRSLFFATGKKFERQRPSNGEGMIKNIFRLIGKLYFFQTNFSQNQGKNVTNIAESVSLHLPQGDHYLGLVLNHRASFRRTPPSRCL